MRILVASGIATTGLSLMLELAAARPVVAMPFARNCQALEAYVNQVGRTMKPPLQVSELGDWYQESNYVGCESGQVVRYLQSSTEVCRLHGIRLVPYTAVGFIPSSNRLKIRTDRCTVLPPQALPWLVNPRRASAPSGERPPRLERSTTWGVLLLAAGLVALTWSAIQFRRRLGAGETPMPLPVLLHEEVAFLLDPPDEASSPAAGTER